MLLKDLTRFLMKFGVDINTGRFIVLQFEVKNIADMPPKSNKIDYNPDKP